MFQGKNSTRTTRCGLPPSAKTKKGSFGHSQHMILSLLSFPIADLADYSPSRKASSRRPLIRTKPNLHSSHHTHSLPALITSSTHIFDAPDVLEAQLPRPPIPYSFTNEVSIKYDHIPCWERLTSNPGPTSRENRSSYQGSVSSKGIRKSTAQSAAWSNTSSDVISFHVVEASTDYGLQVDNPPRVLSLKRKYTDLLDEERGWSRGNQRYGSRADCFHTSELRNLGVMMQ
jgi:hypothetical protein